jgi:hypothetical protein
MRKGLKRDVLTTPEVQVHIFGAGDVEQILEMESWRLQKFLSGKRYQLTPSGGQIGRGRQGSRRVFRVQDVYRLGIAGFLVRDGFAPNCVSSVLQWIEDEDLINFGEKGRTNLPTIGFVRGTDGPKFAEVSDSETILPPAQVGAVYYVLRLAQIVQRIDDRVEKWRKGGL